MMMKQKKTNMSKKEEKKTLRKLHPKAITINPINDGGWSDGVWSVFEEDGFNEYWTSYTFDNGKLRNLGTTTVEI